MSLVVDRINALTNSAKLNATLLGAMLASCSIPNYQHNSDTTREIISSAPLELTPPKQDQEEEPDYSLSFKLFGSIDKPTFIVQDTERWASTFTYRNFLTAQLTYFSSQSPAELEKTEDQLAVLSARVKHASEDLLAACASTCSTLNQIAKKEEQGIKLTKTEVKILHDLTELVDCSVQLEALQLTLTPPFEVLRQRTGWDNGEFTSASVMGALDRSEEFGGIPPDSVYENTSAIDAGKEIFKKIFGKSLPSKVPAPIATKENLEGGSWGITDEETLQTTYYEGSYLTNLLTYLHESSHLVLRNGETAESSDELDEAQGAACYFFDEVGARVIDLMSPRLLIDPKLKARAELRSQIDLIYCSDLLHDRVKEKGGWEWVPQYLGEEEDADILASLDLDLAVAFANLAVTFKAGNAGEAFSYIQHSPGEIEALIDCGKVDFELREKTMQTEAQVSARWNEARRMVAKLQNDIDTALLR